MENKRNGWRTDGNGTRQHFLDGELHREDGPTVIYPSGYQAWYRNGELHREDGPAIIHPDGRNLWCRNGELHRADGPAAIFPDGYQDWYLNDKPVRMETVLNTPEKMEAYLLEESLRRL